MVGVYNYLVDLNVNTAPNCDALGPWCTVCPETTCLIDCGAD